MTQNVFTDTADNFWNVSNEVVQRQPLGGVALDLISQAEGGYPTFGCLSQNLVPREAPHVPLGHSVEQSVPTPWFSRRAG